MIALHRLRGDEMILNADLIESVEATPDTVITLIDGRKMAILETPDQVVHAVRLFRASVLRTADDIRHKPGDLVSIPSHPQD